MRPPPSRSPAGPAPSSTPPPPALSTKGGQARSAPARVSPHPGAPPPPGGRSPPLRRGEEHLPRQRAEAVPEVMRRLDLLDAHESARRGVGGQERRARVALVQVLDDGARLVERDAVVRERGHLAVRAARQVLGRLVLALLEAEQDGLVGEALLLERQLHA